MGEIYIHHHILIDLGNWPGGKCKLSWCCPSVWQFLAHMTWGLLNKMVGGNVVLHFRIPELPPCHPLVSRGAVARVLPPGDTPGVTGALYDGVEPWSCLGSWFWMPVCSSVLLGCTSGSAGILLESR
jgi:hypothetical protein